MIEGTNTPETPAPVVVEHINTESVPKTDGEAPKADPFEALEQKVKEKKAQRSEKTKSAMLQKELESLKRTLKEFQEREAEFDKDPNSFITKRGKKLEDLVDASLDKPAEDPVQSKLSTLEKELEEMKREKAERQAKDANDAFVGKIKDTIKSMGEKAELVAAYDGWEQVKDAMETHYAQLLEKFNNDQDLAFSNLLPIEKYVEAAEGHIEEYIAKAKGTPKLSRMFGVSSVPQKSPTATLNNRAASAPSLSKDPNDMTPAERDAMSASILRAARSR